MTLVSTKGLQDHLLRSRSHGQLGVAKYARMSTRRAGPLWGFIASQSKSPNSPKPCPPSP